MADYLLPNNNLSNFDKQRIFAIRNKMIEIPNNFPMGNKETNCSCGEKEEMPHIYYCEQISENRKLSVKYETFTKITWKNNLKYTKDLKKILKQEKKI